MTFKKLRQMITIKGNKNLVSKEYPVSSFLNLHLSVNGRVELYQGDEEKVEITTDDNLLPFIGVVNSGKTLFVTSEEGYRRPEFTQLTAKIYLRQISKLNIRCSGGEVTTPHTISLAQSLEIKIQSVGNTELKLDLPFLKMLIQNEGNVILSGKCGEAEIKSQSEGNLFARELLADHLKIKNMSEGNVEVFAANTISISHYGEGFIHYYGEGRLIDVNQRGEGEIKHKKHEATYQ
jgi:hypothetical protein